MIHQLHSPWSLIYENIDSSNFDHHQVDVPYTFTMVDHVDDDYDPYDIIMDDYELSTLLTTSENSTISEVNSILITNNQIQFPIDEETLILPSLMEFEPFESILCPQIVDIHDHVYQEESDSQNFPYDAMSPTLSMKSELSSIQSQNHESRTIITTTSLKMFDFNQNCPALTLPQENMEIENQVSLPHLMEAHGEALEQGQKSLAEVNLKCISQKVTTPIGESLEKLAFYLSQEVTNHGDYLKGEAYKNFEDAFKVLYQGNPIGKIAHFSAISSILEAAMLEDCDEIHIIDFCIGDGVQWPFLLEDVSKMNKRLKLTSIKWCDENSECVWNFEETKRNLYEYGKSCGLILMVEEKGLEELVSEINIMNKRGLRNEFLAFNLMIGLPHMVRRKRRDALEFLKVAEDLIKNCGRKGIITFGDGDVFEKLKNSLNFKEFFEGNLVHYKALLESIESQFSAQFSEAKTVCEVLFVAPCIDTLAWLQTWEEMKSDDYLQNEIGIKGSRLTKNILMEVSEVLRGSESLYQARIEGENENQLVLEWKGTQLLRFSIWKH